MTVYHKRHRKEFIRDKVRTMAKVTSKYQVTIPKALAENLGIEPGHEIDWSAAGDSIRLTPSRAKQERLTFELRLELFDQATRRQRKRQKRKAARPSTGGRGWRRDDLYHRGRTR
jgi:AbrB family looped-hinge helix DNA binding protein